MNVKTMSNIKTTWIDTSYLGIAQTESAQSDKRWPMPYCLCNTCFLLWLLRSASSCRSPSSGHRVCVCWTDWCPLVIGQRQLWGGGTWPIGRRRAGGERDRPDPHPWPRLVSLRPNLCENLWKKCSQHRFSSHLKNNQKWYMWLFFNYFILFNQSYWSNLI